jgi:riboflavin biosynthesis pyrimidine reductase
VSASLDLPWDEDLFTGSTVRPIVLTTRGPDPARHAARVAAAAQHADVIALPSAQVLDPAALLAALEQRGLHRIVCEGGPRLLAAIALAGLLDEADVTIAPLLVGGGQVETGTPLPTSAHFDLAQVIVDDNGFSYHRYLVAGRP